MANEISIYRGDTPTFTVTVLDNGSAMDLTGYTMTMTVKENEEDSDLEAKFQKTATISTPASGIGLITLTYEDSDLIPNIYSYDVQLNNGTSNIFTCIKSTFTVKQDITITTN